MAAYIALIRKDDGTAYGVEFPDFPGCISAGATLDAALRGAREALELHIDGMIEDGRIVPAPSPLDGIAADPANAGALAVLVEGPAERAVRVNVTLEESLLARIDRFVAESDFPGGRSGFIARSTRERLTTAEAAADVARAAQTGKLKRKRAAERAGRPGALKADRRAAAAKRPKRRA